MCVHLSVPQPHNQNGEKNRWLFKAIVLHVATTIFQTGLTQHTLKENIMHTVTCKNTMGTGALGHCINDIMTLCQVSALAYSVTAFEHHKYTLGRAYTN